jgi:hypothetical protein
MEPVTLIVGLWLLKMLGGKKGTPAAAAATAEEVDKLSEAIERSGMSAVNQITKALGQQVAALGLKGGGVGFQGGFTAYLQPAGAGVLQQVDIDKASNLWNQYQHAVSAANMDGSFDHSEAQNIIVSGNSLAAELFNLATVKEQREASKKA